MGGNEVKQSRSTHETGKKKISFLIVSYVMYETSGALEGFISQKPCFH